MGILSNILIVTPPDMQNAGHKDDEDPTGMSVVGQLTPQPRHSILGKWFVAVLDHRHLFHSCEVLQVGDLVTQQLRRDHVGEGSQNVCNVCDELVVGQLQLLVLTLLVVLPQHIVLDPLRTGSQGLLVDGLRVGARGLEVLLVGFAEGGV